MKLFLPLSLLSTVFSQMTRTPSDRHRRGISSSSTVSDPFYQPPIKYKENPLGTILKSRKLKTFEENVIIPNFKFEGYQLLYRTESQNGTALAAITTILLPDKFSSDPPNVISYHPAEDSTAEKCSPSHTYLSGLNLNSIEIPIIKAFLLQGWMIVIPDYEGPNGGYVMGRLQGKLVLDSLRATLKYPPLGLTNSTKIGLAGYSGGSTPSAWGAALHPTYAPELNIVGAAYGGTPADLLLTFQNIDGTLYSGFVFAGVTAAVNTYSSIAKFATKYGTEAHREFLKFSNENCYVEMLLRYPFQRYESKKFISWGKDVLSHPIVNDILKENSIGLEKSEVPIIPQYIYHSQFDQIVTVKGIDKAVGEYCKMGIKSLIYDRSIGPADHVSQALIGLPRVFRFFIDRFNGVPPQKGCQTRFTSTLDMLSNPGVVGTGLENVWQDIQDLM